MKQSYNELHLDKELKSMTTKLNLTTTENKEILKQLNLKLDEQQKRVKKRFNPYYLSVAVMAAILLIFLAPVLLQQDSQQSEAPVVTEAGIEQIISETPVNTITYRFEEYEQELTIMKNALIAKEELEGKPDLEEVFPKTITIEYKGGLKEVYRVWITSEPSGEDYTYRGYFLKENGHTFYKLDVEAAELMFGMFAN
ncbi:hypothetical protein [Litchfieldia salsa]|uniref:Uncharacterized protein n=1 Tax=Litchfieldia salsa TaxID=930152 RepID=A0A1H0U118_9BACI|nr:hypothetical protein [Litchfieldia salsa]SDP59831.1 hypothetical protein SAMN05216565_10473 [Litchfieldia salsa]